MIKSLSNLSFVILFLFSGCTTAKLKRQGYVSQENYVTQIPFDYKSGFIIVPIEINGKTYHFLLDTGAELNVIDPSIAEEINLKNLKTGTMSNAQDSKKGLERVEIPSIRMGGINFEHTVGMVLDLSAFSKYIRCDKIDGFIGNNLMRKANWQIDYKNQFITISDDIQKLKVGQNARKIKMEAGDINNIYLDIEVNGIKIPFTFDTGYNGFAQTGETKLLKNTKSIAKIGIKGANFTGVKTGATHYLDFKNFNLNGEIFDAPYYFLVKPKNSSVLGNSFFEDYIITIDWENDYLILDQVNEVSTQRKPMFEVSFITNFEKGIVTLASVYEKSPLINDIEPASQVLFINGVDLNEMHRNGSLCEFWHREWKEISKTDTLSLILISNGNQKEVKAYRIKP